MNAPIARLLIKLTPSGGADRIEGRARDGDGAEYLKVRVCAAPEDNKANEALIALMAKRLGVAKRDIQIVRGATSRRKTLEIAGLDSAALARFLSEFKEG